MQLPFSLRLNRVKVGLKGANDAWNRRDAQRQLLRAERDEALTRHTEAVQRLGKLDLVQILLQKTSDVARAQTKTTIEEIVSQALNVVFREHYRFDMRLETNGNIPEVEYWLSKNGVWTQLKKPDYDNGGGIIDIITLALRLAIVEIEKVPGTLWLDEVGKHVDGEAAINVAYFLKQYIEQFQRQIVLVTHNTSLQDSGDAGAIIYQVNDESRVKQ